MPTERTRAQSIEIERTRVELMQRDLAITQAGLKLLEIDNERVTIEATVEKLQGLKEELGEKLRQLEGAPETKENGHGT